LLGERAFGARRGGIEALQSLGRLRDARAFDDLGQCVSRGVSLRRAGNECQNGNKHKESHGKLAVI